MAKSKEEVLKTVEQNYYDVQKKKLDTMDEFANLHKTFKKQEGELEKDYKATSKSIDKEQQSIEADYQQLEERRNQRLVEHENQIEENKKTSKEHLENEQKNHAAKESKEIKAIEKDIKTIQSDFNKQRESATKKLEKSREETTENIQAIQEKSAKDQASFEQKRNDLQSKYEEKIKSLEEKEANKLAKLQETAEKKIAGLEEDIKSKEEKAAKDKQTKQALYEEELAEIDEKIDFEKNEYEEKYANIKDSAEKRIAVREKHLQRALNDNDSRSAKQHKKDIAQFRKEASRDLSLLDKNYAQQEKSSTDYRKRFIVDHFEDLAEMDRKLVEYKEEKLLAIEQVKIDLNHDSETTKLEYETNRAKELDKFNQNFAEVREKQESVYTKHQLDIKQAQHELNVLEIETNKELELSLEKEKESIERKEKERREAVLAREHADALSLNAYEEALVRLENEHSVSKLETERDIVVLGHERQIKLHALQDKRHQGMKHLFHGYQQYIQPLFVGRITEAKLYQEKEINNRLKLALDFQDVIQQQIEEDYQVLVDKIESAHQQEAAYLETTIDAVAGELKSDLAEYIKETEASFVELKSNIEGLTNFSDRKERKALESELASKEEEFEREKAKMETELSQKVGVYQTLLQDVKQRKDIALQDAKEIRSKQSQVVQQSIQTAKESAQLELEQLQSNMNQTESAMQHFELQVASRNQRQTDAHNQYLKAKVEQEKQATQYANDTYDRSKELLQQDMEQKVAELAATRNNLIASNRSNMDQEENQFEQFKQSIDDAMDTIRNAANEKLAAENTDFTTQKNQLDSELNIELNNIKNTLQTQAADFNQLLDEIKKREQKESTVYDNEQKRVKKDKEERLKVALSTIHSELQQNIQSI